VSTNVTLHADHDVAYFTSGQHRGGCAGGCRPASSAAPLPGSSRGSPAASLPGPWPTDITASRCSKATLAPPHQGSAPRSKPKTPSPAASSCATLITSHGQHPLTGPAAAEAEARLADLERHVTFDGKVITDARRLRRIMDRHDPRIYPGQYVACVYNPDRALCRRAGDAPGPSLPDCQPLACRNVALTSGNIAALAVHQAHLEQALQPGEVIAPYVRHRLEEQLTEMTVFLARHGQPRRDEP